MKSSISIPRPILSAPSGQRTTVRATASSMRGPQTRRDRRTMLSCAGRGKTAKTLRAAEETWQANRSSGKSPPTTTTRRQPRRPDPVSGAPTRPRTPRTAARLPARRPRRTERTPRAPSPLAAGTRPSILAEIEGEVRTADDAAEERGMRLRRGSAGQSRRRHRPGRPRAGDLLSPSSRAPPRMTSTPPRLGEAALASWATHRTPTRQSTSRARTQDIHITYDRPAADRVRHERQAASRARTCSTYASASRWEGEGFVRAWEDTAPTSAWWTSAARRKAARACPSSRSSRSWRTRPSPLPGRRSRRGRHGRTLTPRTSSTPRLRRHPDRPDHTMARLHDRRDRECEKAGIIKPARSSS